VSGALLCWCDLQECLWRGKAGFGVPLAVVCFMTASRYSGMRWGYGETRQGASTALRRSLDFGGTRMVRLWLDLRVRWVIEVGRGDGYHC
jgi:hypothetical protein